MPLVPIATFLAGSLLTLLIPVLLLIALVVWYWKFSASVPDTAHGPDAGTAPASASPGAASPGAANPAANPGAANPAAANPGPPIPENLPPEPGA